MASIKKLDSDAKEVTLTLSDAEVAFLEQTAAAGASIATYLKVTPVEVVTA